MSTRITCQTMELEMKSAFAFMHLSRIISFFKNCFWSFHFDSILFHFRFVKIVSSFEHIILFGEH